MNRVTILLFTIDNFSLRNKRIEKWDWSIFIGGGGVQKAIGHILFTAKIFIELELFSTLAMIG